MSEQTLAEDLEVRWCIHSRHQKLLIDVRTCIDNIDSLEMASASFYFVMNHLPPGKPTLNIMFYVRTVYRVPETLIYYCSQALIN